MIIISYNLCILGLVHERVHEYIHNILLFLLNFVAAIRIRIFLRDGTYSSKKGC